MKESKTLLILDFDNTVVNCFSSDTTLTLLKNQDLVYQIRHSPDPWSDCMQKAFLEMKKEGIKIESLKEKIENIKMNENMPDLFEYVIQNREKYDLLIVSGSTMLFLGWFLEKNHLTDIVKSYYALPTEINEELFVKIGNIDHPVCKNGCKADQCKTHNIEDYLSKHLDTKYERFVYVGDGDNDFCGALILKEGDYLFVRNGYKLQKMLIEGKKEKEIKSKIMYWDTGLDIIKIMKEIKKN